MNEPLARLFTNRYGQDLDPALVEVKVFGDLTWIEVSDEFESPRMRKPVAETLHAIAAITGWPEVEMAEIEEGACDTCRMGSRFGFSFSAHR
jgi:hypothetical protein